MYCYEVLEHILRKYHAHIRQIGARYIIYRPDDLDGSVSGRIFTAPTIKGVAPDLNFPQFINRSTTSSDLIDLENGTLMVLPPIKKITIHQDYGDKESWVDNYKFEAKEWNVNDFNYWTQISGNHIMPISNFVIGEKDGVVIDVGVGALYQIITSSAVASLTDYFTIEFDYGYYNLTAAQVNGVDIFINLQNATTKVLQEVDGTTCEWVNVAGAVPIVITEDVPIGWTGWKTWTRQFTGIALDGELKVLLYDTAVADVFACYKNVKISASSIQILEKVRTNLNLRLRGQIGITNVGNYATEQRDVTEYDLVIDNAANGKNLEYSFLLGDVPNISTPASDADVNIENVLNQFAGSLAVTEPLYRVDSIEVTGSSGTAIYVCNGIGLLATWNPIGLNQTATDFVTSHAAAYAAGTPSITITANTHFVIFTSTVLGADFTGPTSASNVSGNLSGIRTYSFPARSTTNLLPTTLWNTRGGSENKPLLVLIGDEIAAQTVRPRQFISLPILEDNSTLPPHVNLLGNFQDDLNKVSGVNRKFVFNKGLFKCIDREWNIDLVEIL
jgi:hypothetical protein